MFEVVVGWLGSITITVFVCRGSIYIDFLFGISQLPVKDANLLRVPQHIWEHKSKGMMKATACGCIFVHAFVCMWEAPLPIYTHANKRQGVKCASGRLLPPTPDSPEYAPKACWFAILSVFPRPILVLTLQGSLLILHVPTFTTIPRALVLIKSPRHSK